jgi:nicotinate-nucleotide pyrophosphorylase (carboxylating)
MSLLMNIQELINRIIDLALEEDGADITSNALFETTDRLKAKFTSKSSGIIAGLDIAGIVFKKLDENAVFEKKIDDGSHVKAGTIIAIVTGGARALLKAERVALNFMQRMSGIATMTDLFIKELQGTRAILLDTRKTAPGLRVLDKSAFRLGGGQNHRMGLYDMALIKDNHIDRVGSIAEAVRRVTENSPAIPIVVEARNLDEVKELLPLKVDRIMLDNFSIDDMLRAVMLVNHRLPLEASGGITLNTIRKVALTGVDYISVGEVTHSVKAFDISMTIGRSDD